MATYALDLQAACNNPQLWAQTPSEGVKYFRGYVPRDEMLMFGHERFIGRSKETAYPPLLSESLWTKSGTTQGDRSSTSYFEPDGRGHWRICRIELWTGHPTYDGRSILETYLKYQVAENPIIEERGKGWAVESVEAFQYDDRGRLSEQRRAWIRPDGVEVTPKCYRYDDQDRLLLYVHARNSLVCPTGAPELRDDWNSYQFIEHASKTYVTREERHRASESGKGWISEIFFDPPEDAATGGATVNNSRGVLSTEGPRWGKLDNNNGQTPVKYGNAEYTFPRTDVVAPSVIDNPDEIYRYDRRREAKIGVYGRRLDWFRANSHVSRDSFIAAAGYVVRHEQRDEQGKLRRVINVSFEESAGKKGLYYQEPKFKKALRLLGREYVYRVWEYDEKGQEKLVAIGWNKSFKRGVNIDKMNIAFGTPDGRVKWKTKEDFFKAFDFDAHAQRIPSNPSE